MIYYIIVFVYDVHAHICKVLLLNSCNKPMWSATDELWRKKYVLTVKDYMIYTTIIKVINFFVNHACRLAMWEQQFDYNCYILEVVQRDSDLRIVIDIVHWNIKCISICCCLVSLLTANTDYSHCVWDSGKINIAKLNIIIAIWILPKLKFFVFCRSDNRAIIQSYI